MLFLADGLIALAIFPTVAAAAPQLFSADGALNRGPALAAFVVIAVTNMIGYIVLGAATLRAGPSWRGAPLADRRGALQSATGAVLWGVGTVWLGVALHSLGASAELIGPAT